MTDKPLHNQDPKEIQAMVDDIATDYIGRIRKVEFRDGKQSNFDHNMSQNSVMLGIRAQARFHCKMLFQYGIKMDVNEIWGGGSAKRPMALSEDAVRNLREMAEVYRDAALDYLKDLGNGDLKTGLKKLDPKIREKLGIDEAMMEKNKQILEKDIKEKFAMSGSNLHRGNSWYDYGSVSESLQELADNVLDSLEIPMLSTSFQVNNGRAALDIAPDVWAKKGGYKKFKYLEKEANTSYLGEEEGIMNPDRAINADDYAKNMFENAMKLRESNDGRRIRLRLKDYAGALFKDPEIAPLILTKFVKLMDNEGIKRDEYEVNLHSQTENRAVHTNFLMKGDELGVRTTIDVAVGYLSDGFSLPDMKKQLIDLIKRKFENKGITIDSDKDDIALKNVVNGNPKIALMDEYRRDVNVITRPYFNAIRKKFLGWLDAAKKYPALTFIAAGGKIAYMEKIEESFKNIGPRILAAINNITEINFGGGWGGTSTIRFDMAKYYESKGLNATEEISKFYSHPDKTIKNNDGTYSVVPNLDEGRVLDIKKFNTAYYLTKLPTDDIFTFEAVKDILIGKKKIDTSSPQINDRAFYISDQAHKVFGKFGLVTPGSFILSEVVGVLNVMSFALEGKIRKDGNKKSDERLGQNRLVYGTLRNMPISMLPQNFINMMTGYYEKIPAINKEGVGDINISNTLRIYSIIKEELTAIAGGVNAKEREKPENQARIAKVNKFFADAGLSFLYKKGTTEIDTCKLSDFGLIYDQLKDKGLMNKILEALEISEFSSGRKEDLKAKLTESRLKIPNDEMPAIAAAYNGLVEAKLLPSDMKKIEHPSKVTIDNLTSEQRDTFFTIRLVGLGKEKAYYTGLINAPKNDPYYNIVGEVIDDKMREDLYTRIRPKLLNNGSPSSDDLKEISGKINAIVEESFSKGSAAAKTDIKATLTAVAVDLVIKTGLEKEKGRTDGKGIKDKLSHGDIIALTQKVQRQIILDGHAHGRAA